LGSDHATGGEYSEAVPSAFADENQPRQTYPFARFQMPKTGATLPASAGKFGVPSRNPNTANPL
jgi:hypothetical protein